MAFEHSDQIVLGMTSSAPKDFEAWEKLAAPPEIYSPPQEAEHWFRKLVYKTLKSSCCGCVPPVRMCCSPCWPVQRVDITVSDEWLEQMLKVESNKNAPDSLSGAWWMQDNIAAENVLTFNDGEWASESVGKRISKYNWTIDAWNLWGLMLSNNSWTWGGEHVFEYSPDRKWIHITYGASSSSNWIYVIQPGDVFKTPDGQVIDVTPGEDMLRVSYETLDTKSKVTFQYWLRRIAYLDADGKLVKTPNYDKLMKAAESSTQFCGCCDCGDSKVGAMQRTQAFTIAPPQQVSMSTYEEVGTAV